MLQTPIMQSPQWKESFRSRDVGALIRPQCLTNFLQYPISPRKPHTASIILGYSHFIMHWTFLGSTTTPSLDTTWPKYSTFLHLKLHLESLPKSLRRRRRRIRRKRIKGTERTVHPSERQTPSRLQLGHLRASPTPPSSSSSSISWGVFSRK